MLLYSNWNMCSLCVTYPEVVHSTLKFFTTLLASSIGTQTWKTLILTCWVQRHADIMQPDMGFQSIKATAALFKTQNQLPIHALIRLRPFYRSVSIGSCWAWEYSYVMYWISGVYVLTYMTGREFSHSRSWYLWHSLHWRTSHSSDKGWTPGFLLEHI